jgi:hypothetical protein
VDFQAVPLSLSGTWDSPKRDGNSKLTVQFQLWRQRVGVQWGMCPLPSSKRRDPSSHFERVIRTLERICKDPVVAITLKPSEMTSKAQMSPITFIVP